MTPEERQRIYLEEKARLEARQTLAAENKKTGCGSTIGIVVLGVVALLVVLAIIGSMIQQSESAKFNALTPEQKHAQTVQNCVEIEKGWAFKTYSELTPEERKVKFSCDAILSESSH